MGECHAAVMSDVLAHAPHLSRGTAVLYILHACFADSAAAGHAQCSIPAVCNAGATSWRRNVKIKPSPALLRVCHSTCATRVPFFCLAVHKPLAAVECCLLAGQGTM